jgi:hypothetical protein
LFILHLPSKNCESLDKVQVISLQCLQIQVQALNFSGQKQNVSRNSQGMFKGTKQHIKNLKKKHKNDLLPESSNLIQFTLGAWPRHIQRCRSGPWLALEAAQASEWTKTVVQEIENKTSIKYKLVLFVSFLSVIFCLYDTVCICLCSVSASICTLYGPGSAMRCQENWSAYQEKCPFLRPAGTFNIGAAESNLWLEQMGGPCLCLAMLRFHLCAASKHFLSFAIMKPRQTFHTLHIVQSISSNKPNRRWLQNTSSQSRVPKLTQLRTLWNAPAVRLFWMLANYNLASSRYIFLVGERKWKIYAF